MTISAPPASIRRVRANGADVRVSVRGEGAPLLLLMGIGAPLELWNRLESELAPRGRQLIAIDLPGTGASPAVLPPKRMRGLVRIATDVLDHLGHTQVDVLGVSFGGGVAQEFARRAPERTRRLVLAATSTGGISVPARPSVLIHLATPLRYLREPYGNRIIGDLYGGRVRTDPDVRNELKVRLLLPPTAVGYLGQLTAAAGWTSVHWLHRIKVPTLVMFGDDDPIIPSVNARILAALIPDARLHIMRGGGHLFLLDSAAESAEVIHEFLS